MADWWLRPPHGGLVRLFDPAKGELIDVPPWPPERGHGIAFSADGRRLISTSGGREAVKLWDVGTRQELLTLGGTGSLLDAARWSADGDVILAGAPWQAWRAPSWEEIAAAEAKEKTAIKRKTADSISSEAHCGDGQCRGRPTLPLTWHVTALAARTDCSARSSYRACVTR